VSAVFSWLAGSLVKNVCASGKSSDLHMRGNWMVLHNVYYTVYKTADPVH
jgi:hypothetical protein